MIFICISNSNIRLNIESSGSEEPAMFSASPEETEGKSGEGLRRRLCEEGGI